MGIKIEQREGMHELTLPGLMPKRRSTRGIEYLIDPLMAALERFAREHGVVRFPTTQSALSWSMTEPCPSGASGTTITWS